MSNVTKYVMLMTGLVIIFYFGGLIDRDRGGIEISLLNMMITEEGRPADLKASDLWSKAGVALTVLSVTGIVAIGVGILTRSIRTPLRIVFALYLGNLMWNFRAVYLSVADTNPFLAILIFAPLLVVWIVTLVEWGLQ